MIRRRTEVLLATAVMLFGTACSSSDGGSEPSVVDDSPTAGGEQPSVPAPAGDANFSRLVGVWDASSLDNGSPASRLFVIRENGTLTDTSPSRRENCYNEFEVELTPLGDNQYETGVAGVVTMAIENDMLMYSYPEGDGIEAFSFPRIAGLSVQDIQGCS